MFLACADFPLLSHCPAPVAVTSDAHLRATSMETVTGTGIEGGRRNAATAYKNARGRCTWPRSLESIPTKGHLGY